MEESLHPGAEGVESAFLKNARCRGLERTFLETTAAGRLASGDIVAICADPGMGKSQLAAAIMGHLSFDALDTISLSGLDEDLACIRLARASRRIAPNLRKGKSVGIIIDDIGPADEFGVERMDRTIVRLQKLGASIILTMRPEAEQILDGLERYIRIGKSDLMVREQEIVPSNRAEAIMRESEGIPELVDVLQSHASAFGAPDTFMPAFGETLSRIAKDSLRETLLDAERASRFAAMLLGHGTWDELRASVEGWHPDEAIAALREAVLVAVDHAAQTFRCVGLSDDIGFMYCSEMLRSEAAQWPSCAVAAASILIGRNEVRRAARIVEWLEPERRRAFELRYGLALLNAGETALVREAMSEPTYSEDVSPYALSTLSSAYDAIWLQEGTAKGVLEDRVFATAEDERDALRARLIARSRKLLHEASDGSALDPFERSDGMVSAFATHAEALALLEHGRVGDCRNLLRMRRPDDAGGSLGAALLAIDEEIANTLMCEGNQDDSLRMRRSEDFFERMGLTPLVGWGGILGSVRDTICGIVVPHGLDAATALAERRGNTVLAAALCCTVVLSDLLRRAPVSAHVKAQHAIALSERGCCGVLSDIAAILQAISANSIEEPAAYRKLLHRAWSCEQVGAVGDIVCAAL